MQSPRPGTVEDGFIFIGGDPGQEANWRPVQTLEGADVAQLTKARDAAQRAQSFYGMAEQFMERNRRTGTGPLAFVQGALPGTAGSDIRAMTALQARAAPMLRTAGDPSTKEMEMYKAGFPSPANWRESNQAIVADLNRETSKAAARASYLEKWGQTTGSLAGADAAFERWWANRSAGGQKKPPPVAPPPRAAGGRQSGVEAMPQAGEIRDGWRFKGGNPNDQRNWQKVTP